MEALIQVTKDLRVDARELHLFLEVQARFNDWIRRRVEEYTFVQGIDFTLLKSEYNEIKEFWLTLDMAKELCMVERTEKGRLARKYFIEVEKKYRRLVPGGSRLDMVQAMLDEARAQEARLTQHDADIIRLDSRVKNFEGSPGFLTIAAYATKVGKRFGLEAAKELGKRASLLCRERGIARETVRSSDPRFTSVGAYPEEILEHVFSSYFGWG